MRDVGTQEVDCSVPPLRLSHGSERKRLRYPELWRARPPIQASLKSLGVGILV